MVKVAGGQLVIGGGWPASAYRSEPVSVSSTAYTIVKNRLPMAVLHNSAKFTTQTCLASTQTIDETQNNCHRAVRAERRGETRAPVLAAAVYRNGLRITQASMDRSATTILKCDNAIR